jgi:hydroxyacyl-ACP dehydratase HTD2-like protein with hotdog domain
LTALLTEELKSWIGREAHYAAREELGRASIRYFALAIGDDNPLYVNGEVAPPTLICETNQYAHQAPNADGYIGHEWHLPVPNTRLVRAGNDYEFMRPILPTDRISVTWTLESIVEKASSRGGTQLFVSSVARYRDAQGELVAINRETIVYQPLR